MQPWTPPTRSDDIRLHVQLMLAPVVLRAAGARRQSDSKRLLAVMIILLMMLMRVIVHVVRARRRPAPTSRICTPSLIARYVYVLLSAVHLMLMRV